MAATLLEHLTTAHPLRRLRSPATQTDLLQLVKSVVAAVAAWLVAVDVFDLQQPFLAPWVGLLTVHATVYRTLSRGAQSVAATGVGIVLSFLAALVLGTGTASLAMALLVALAVARLRMLRTEGITVATTALFVLTTSHGAEPVMLLARLFDTSIGVGVGLLVNLIFFPPLNNRSAQRHVDDINRELGRLLVGMATQIGAADGDEDPPSWVERTRALDDRLEHAWRVVRHAHEASVWNPRYRLSGRWTNPANFRFVLVRLEGGIAETRSMARVVDESARTARGWDPRFRRPWLDLLEETGLRIADPDAEVASLRKRLDVLIRELSGHDLPDLSWPVYGALISNLATVVDVVDDVASSRPVRT